MIFLKVMQINLNNNFYGAERVTWSLCKGLHDAGVTVVVVASQALQEKFCEAHPSALYALPSHGGSLLKRAPIIPMEMNCLRQIISKERPDIVHVHGSLARIVTLAVARDQLVVETLHGVSPTREAGLERVVFRVADLLAGLSFDGNIFYASGIMGGHSRLRLLRPSAVIYNPVDTDFLKLIARTTEPPVDHQYILWCSRLDAVKGTDLLVRAFARLQRPDLKLVFLGEGPQRGYLESLVRSLDIEERTMFLGYVDGIEKARFFQHASAVCVDLVNPGISQSLLEAVFSGRPVVACYDPEVERMFGESAALLSGPSVSELATILLETLENGQRRNHPGTLDASLEKRFSLGYFTQQYLAFYSMLESGSSR